MAFVILESVENLHDGYSRCFKLDGRQLLLVQSSGHTRLLPIQCPHERSSLKKAKLTDGEIRCPKHGISFDLESGQAIGGEVVADVAPLQPVGYSIQNGDLGVYLD